MENTSHSVPQYTRKTQYTHLNPEKLVFRFKLHAAQCVISNQASFTAGSFSVHFLNNNKIKRL